jgi:16S rRNA processing protein RimM
VSALPELIVVGRIRRAHGIHGEVLVEPITDAPDTIFVSGRRVLVEAHGEADEDGPASLTITSSRPFKQGYLVTFDRIADRTAAESWRDRYLLLPATELPPLAENEVYVHDLIGMHVVLSSGEALGTVREVYELPQGLVVDVGRDGGGGSVMLPYQPEVIIAVDQAARTITAEPPPGLLD